MIILIMNNLQPFSVPPIFVMALFDIKLSNIETERGFPCGVVDLPQRCCLIITKITIIKTSLESVLLLP